MIVSEKQRSNEELDKQLAFKAAHSQLTDEELCDWRNCQHTFRTQVHYDKLFIAWYMDGSVPIIQGSLRFLEPSIDHKAGFSVQVLEVDNGEETELSVDHGPCNLFNGKVFAHIPYIVNGFYTPEPKRGNFVLRLPMVFKVEGRPWNPSEGLQLSPFSDFKSKHEKYKGLTQHDL